MIKDSVLKYQAGVSNFPFYYADHVLPDFVSLTLFRQFHQFSNAEELPKLSDLEEQENSLHPLCFSGRISIDHGKYISRRIPQKKINNPFGIPFWESKPGLPLGTRKRCLTLERDPRRRPRPGSSLLHPQSADTEDRRGRKLRASSF